VETTTCASFCGSTIGWPLDVVVADITGRTMTGLAATSTRGLSAWSGAKPSRAAATTATGAIRIIGNPPVGSSMVEGR